MKLDRVLETCLYVDDLDRAAEFYEEVLELKALTSDARFRAYDVGGESVLLLFRRGATLETVRMGAANTSASISFWDSFASSGIRRTTILQFELPSGASIRALTLGPRGVF